MTKLILAALALATAHYAQTVEPLTGSTYTGDRAKINRNLNSLAAASSSAASTRCVSASSSATAYTCALSPAITTCATDMRILWTPDVTSGAAPTLNAGCGAKALKTNENVAVETSQFASGVPVELRYDGTAWRAPAVIPGSAGGTATGTFSVGATVLAGEVVSPGSSRLAAWKSSLATKTASIGIVVIGDSIGSGFNSGGAGTSQALRLSSGWVGLLNMSLQKTYGNHGPGLILNYANNNNYTWTKNGSWTGLANTGPYGSASVDESTVWSATGTGGAYSSTISYTLPAIVADSFSVLTYRASDSGECSVVIDGGAATVIANATNATPAPVLTTVSAGFLGAHIVSVGPNGSANKCYFAGVAPTIGSTGVSVHNLSQNGAKSAAFGATTGEAGNLGFLALLSPSLLIVEIGINDFNAAVSVDEFQTQYGNILTAGVDAGASLLILGEPPTAATDGAALWASYRSALRTLAQAYNAELLDITSRWGTYAAANAAGLIYSNHPNTAGHADIAVYVQQLLLDSGVYNGVASGASPVAGAGSIATPGKLTQTASSGIVSESVAFSDGSVLTMGAENLITRSEPTLAQLGAVSGTITQASFTALGLTNGISVPAASQLDYAYLPAYTTVAGQPYTFSMYCRMADNTAPIPGGSTAEYDLYIFFSGTALTDVSKYTLAATSVTGVYRISATYPSTGTDVWFGVVRGANNSGKAFQCSGFQLNFGTSALAYTATAASASPNSAKIRASRLSGDFVSQRVGAVLTSGVTITPTSGIHHVSGTAEIATITVPTNFYGGCITLIPDGVFTTTATGGNISLASTGVPNKALLMCYDGVKWNPSY